MSKVEELVKKLETENSPYKLLDIVIELGEKGSDSKSAIPQIKALRERFRHGEFGRWKEWDSWHIDERFQSILAKIDPKYREKA